MNNRTSGTCTVFTDADNVWGTNANSNRQITYDTGLAREAVLHVLLSSIIVLAVMLPPSLCSARMQAANDEFAKWDYVAMALYSLVDWTLFRELLEFDDYPALLAFVAQNKTQPMIKDSDPRLG